MTSDGEEADEANCVAHSAGAALQCRGSLPRGDGGDATAGRRPWPCEVVVFINPNGPTYRSSAANIVMGDAFDAGILSLFDVAFLNIGNNQENHGIINEVALRRPEVVVVHDFAMQHYVAWKAFEQYRRPISMST